MTLQDNQQLRALLSLPPIQTNASTALSVPEMPPREVVTRDQEIDAVLWLQKVVATGKAPSYLGVSRNTFNRHVRPHLRVIEIGPQGKAFDRLELDAWVELHLEQEGIDRAQPQGEDGLGNSGCAHGNGDHQPWRKTQSQGSSSGAMSGTSTSRSKGMAAFAKALERATAKRHKPT